MAITEKKLRNLIVQSFPKADIKIIDLAGDNDHYRVEITDESFAGKNRITQHKMVNEALKGCVGETLHAMQLITKSN